MLAYPATLTPEPKGCFTVQFPDIPEAITSGKGLEHALSQAADCLGVALAGRLSDGTAIPRPSKARRSHHLVEVPVHVAVKVALGMALSEAGLTKSEFARRLGVSETVVRRLLDPRHASKAEKLRAALAALGKRLIVSVEAAA